MKLLNLLILAAAIFTYACNRSEQPLVEPAEQLPASVKTIMDSQYPTATDISFSILEEDKVFKVSFKVDGVETSIVTNNSDVLNTARVGGKEFRDSLHLKLEGLSIQGGELSNYRVVTSPEGATNHVCDYFLNGISYVLTISETGSINMTTRQLAYYTKSSADLPEKIQKFISDRNKPNPNYINSLPLLQEQLKKLFLAKNELTFTSGSVYVLPSGAKQYEVWINYYGMTNLPLIFNANADLVWVGTFDWLEDFKDFDSVYQGETNLSVNDLVYFQNIFKTGSEFQGFSLGTPVSNTRASLNAYETYGGYQFMLSLQHQNGLPNESWNLAYDTKKQLIYRYYLGQIKR